MTYSLLITVFWAGLGILLYAYLIYPLVLVALKRFSTVPSSAHEPDCFPGVSLVIAAYNEEKVIRDKLNNCLSLNYPDGLLDVWIVSDGSSDKTNEIVLSYINKNERVHLIELPRTGKSGALNEALNYIKSGIIIFSDANTEFAPDAVRNLVRHFRDPQIGCVCGRLIYRNPAGVISGKGEGFYWRYETALKKMESRFGSVAGANGAIYAIRRGLFEPLPVRTINDDFIISMRIVKKGFKSIYDEYAVAYEDVALTVKDEFKRHVRDSAGHYIAIGHLTGLLNPLLGMKSFIYWSHRVLRWAAPFILILLFLINIGLIKNGFYRNVFILQLGFYTWAVAGMVGARGRRLPFFMYIPFYFCNLNTALLFGFFKFLTGRQRMTWQRTERA